MTSLIASLIFSFSIEAAPVSDRRLADLTEHSAFSINLADETLLNERRREWRRGSQADGIKCEIKIASHFEAEEARRAGPTRYFPKQLHSQNYKSIYSGYRDTFSTQLTTENKNLPLLWFDCIRLKKENYAADPGLTVSTVSELLGLPDFFRAAAFTATESKQVKDFAPSLASVKLLQPLRFQSKELSSPQVQDGKLVDEKTTDTARSACVVRLRSPETDKGAYDITLPEGTSFPFQGATGAELSGDYFSFSFNRGITYFEITCMARRDRHFFGFAEIEDHARGILEFTRR